MVKCIDCERERSETYMVEAIFPDTGNGSGVWHCRSRNACRQERKRQRYEGVRCPVCKHPRSHHETEIRWDENTLLVECNYYTGMGDWCGCTVKREDI